jgi:PAS domain S-box-containing protein
MSGNSTAEFAQTLFEEIGDAAFVVDPETEQLLEVNPMAQRLTGLSRAALLRMPVPELFRSKGESGLTHLQRAMHATQTFHSQEGYFLRGRGGDAWTPINVTITRLHTERRPLALILARDITDRMRTEDALRRSEARYHALFNSMTEGFALHEIVTDENGQPCDYRYLDVNRAFERLTGNDRGKIVGALKRQVTPGEDEFWIKTYGAVAQSGQPIRFEHCAPGSNRHWQVYAYSPAPNQFAALFSDISDRKRAEAALRESEARYRLLVESIPQLAWRASADGLEVDCNRRWLEYTGQTPAEAGSRGWLAAVHPDDLSRVGEQMLHAANTRQPYEIEYRLRRAADASYRWHLARAIPLLADDGQVVCWFGSATDIEDLIQAQEILKKAHEEQLQRHRAELAHMARFNMMGAMAASLAHELNQPLHAVKNYAYGGICRLAKTPEKDAELVAALEQISDETNRAAAIVRRVRAFVEKREPEASAVPLNRLVEEVALLGRAEIE